ncbi:MAG TPA: protein kinase [Thermoanaerobaculia bacterium]|nr:protein kinase [Thermoanaerobaculia bacterium]
MEQLGIYRLISRIGAGGMGEVWQAEDTRLLRQVAVKILPESLAADPEWKERFFREARTIAQLNHPNIATIYSIEEHEKTVFIAMELVEGEPLSAIIAQGPMIPTDAVRVATHVADALSEAHRKGIVHRDIKPDNILVSPRFVKVLDFGIAKHIGGTADANLNLTQGGMVVGTPHYMAPEQALGRNVDNRSDIFSLGTVLYEMLSGEKPFIGNAVTEILLQIVMTEPRDIAAAAAGITRPLAATVRKAMQKQPDARFQTCEELRKALVDALKAEQRISGPRQSQVPTISMAKPKPAAEAPPTVMQQPAPQPPPVRPASTPPPPPARVEPSGRRALVADDDPAARYLINSVLQRYQIAVDEAENGADAVKYLKQNDYALVFLDLLMPRVDGWGVIDYLRARRGSRAPQLFVVTGVQNQKLSAADQDVVSGLLYKPIDIGAVEKLVKGV